jgi:NADH-quinone oxidoreductase chain G
MINIYINNILYKVSPTFTVLQACEQALLEVPRFCYHEKLSIAGNCRMCLVEIEKSPKPVASCALPVMTNMSVFTNTPLVKKAREAIIEFLLINHPLDCPICDQGGECDLQDQTLTYGSDKSRFYEWKRSVEDKKIGPSIKTIMTRCIHCTKCIRFASEIGGFAELGAFGRGNKTEIGTYSHAFVKSELSGNMVDLCPVGALTSGSWWPFISRNWELNYTKSIDFVDACGSNIKIYTKPISFKEQTILKKKTFYIPKDNIISILPNQNDLINENWISNKTRFIYDGVTKNRLTTPIIYFNDEKTQCSWQKVFPYLFTLLNNNLKHKYYLNNNKDNITDLELNNLNLKVEAPFYYYTCKKIVGLFSSISDCESIYSLFQFLHLLGSNNIQYDNDLLFINSDISLFYNFNTEIKNIELSDTIFLVGCNPRFEATIINARIKKHTNSNTVKLFSIGSYAELTYPYRHLGNSVKTLIDIVEGKHLVCQNLRLSKYSLIILGTSLLKRRDNDSLINLSRFLGKNLFINSSNFNGYNILHSNIGQVNALTLGVRPGATSNLYLTTDLEKKTDILYTLELAKVNKKKWLKNTTQIINHSSHNLNALAYAELQLPCFAPYEKTNIIINTEGRVQQSHQAITAYGEAQSITKSIQSFIKLFKLENNSITKNLFYFENPQLFYQNKIIKKFNFDFLNYKECKNKVYLSNFLPLISNYYMTDIIGQNSGLMSEHSFLLKLTTNLIKLNEITN